MTLLIYGIPDKPLFYLNLVNQTPYMKKILLVYCLFLWVSCNGDRETIYPTMTRLTESVYASATVQPDSLYQVYATVSGLLERNLVLEGDVVSKGDPILQITNSAPRLSAENARLALELSRENYGGDAAILTELQDEIALASLTYRNDSINFRRQENLWNQNIGSKVEFDNRKLALEQSQNKLKLLQLRYDRTKNELATRVQMDRNNYQTTQIANQDFTVTSKINGKVYALYKNAGEIVNTMEPLAAVGSQSRFLIEMLVDEVDIVKLDLGQRALINLDAYGSEVFTATLSKIYPRKDERSQTFKIEARFDDPPAVLYPGLAGEGNIIIAEKEDALTIPNEYLLEGNMVMTAEGAVEVLPGLRNLERVEILKGIDTTTALIKPKE